MSIRSLLSATALALTTLAFAPATHAEVAYSQGFESGAFGTGWSVGSPYYSDCSGQSNCVSTGASSTASGGAQAGEYYYLGGTKTGPEPVDHRFFISDAFAVDADTHYELTFWLSDAYPRSSGQPYNVPIVAKINGTALGTVSAAKGGWNKIILNWNSGAATSASISLLDEYQLSAYNGAAEGHNWGDGNDFAVDSISLASVPLAQDNNLPEPGSLLLLGMGLAGLGFARRRKV